MAKIKNWMSKRALKRKYKDLEKLLECSNNEVNELEIMQRVLYHENSELKTKNDALKCKLEVLEKEVENSEDESIQLEELREAEKKEYIKQRELFYEILKATLKEASDLWESNGRLIIKVADLQAQKDKLIEIIKRLKLEVRAGEEELANMAAYYNSEIAKANEDLSFKMHNLMTLTDNYEDSEKENKKCYERIAELERKLGEAHTTNAILLSKLNRKKN